MKKATIVFAVLAAVLLAVSCRKDYGTGPMTICAESEVIGMTKTDMSYWCEVLWSAGDRIFVTDGANLGTFSLTDGAGTARGTFKQDGSASLKGDIEVFYPAGIRNDSCFTWPSVQVGGPTIPLYGRKTLSRGSVQEVRLSSLGAVLQIALSTADAPVEVSGIRVFDSGKPLGGPFVIKEGKAVMTGSDEVSTVLDIPGTVIGGAAKNFSLALPAGGYDGFKVTVFTSDGRGSAVYLDTTLNLRHNTVTGISMCVNGFNPLPTGLALDSTSLGLAVGGHHRILPLFTPTDTYNKKVLWSSSDTSVAKVGTDGMVRCVAAGNATITARLEEETISASCAVTVREPEPKPDGALSGLFSVSDNKVVRFAKGNLCKTGDVWGFFDQQYIGRDPNRSVTFSWDEYRSWLSSDSGRAWQVLSSDEWLYLVGNNDFRKGLFATGVTVVGKKGCLVLYPDGYKGSIPSGDSRLTVYDDPDDWARAQADGVVCITADCETDWQDYSTSTKSDTGMYGIFSLNRGSVGIWWGDNGRWQVRPVAGLK